MALPPRSFRAQRELSVREFRLEALALGHAGPPRDGPAPVVADDGESPVEDGARARALEALEEREEPVRLDLDPRLGRGPLEPRGDPREPVAAELDGGAQRRAEPVRHVVQAEVAALH